MNQPVPFQKTWQEEEAIDNEPSFVAAIVAFGLLCQPRKASRGCKQVKNKKCSTASTIASDMQFVIFNLVNPLNPPFRYPVVQKQKAPVIGTGKQGGRSLALRAVNQTLPSALT